MALIKCSECGKEISDKATNCIHCGYKIKNDNNYTDIKSNNQVHNVSNGIPKKIMIISSFVIPIIVIILNNILSHIIIFHIKMGSFVFSTSLFVSILIVICIYNKFLSRYFK